MHRFSCLATASLLITSLLLADAARLQRTSRKAAPSLSLLPWPASVELAEAGAKPFELKPEAVISVGEGVPQDGHTVATLQGVLAELGGKDGKQGVVKVDDSSAVAEGSIRLRLAGKAAAGSAEEQGYSLQVTDKAVELEAPSLEGLFYGVQTLRQLASNKQLPAVNISDAPGYVWRGLHLDVSRHFFTAPQVKKLLDVMALVKLNRFHWHLTDDQGWRLPIQDYPKLTSVGGGGQAYTKEEVQDIVAYAQARHIEVIPEVDVPGHVQSALVAYPELGNSDASGWKAPGSVMQQWGISDYTLAPSNATFAFLGKVFDTLEELFPSKVVHMGGDEVRTGEWSMSAAAKSFLGEVKENCSRCVGDGVAKVFGQKVVELLKARGRRAAAWDEAQHTGSFPDDGIVVAWRSRDEAKQAAVAGRQVVVADIGVLYFDHAQARSGEPNAQGGCSSWKDVFSYDLMPEGLTEAQQDLVLGAQGQLWSEYFPTWEHVEYMAHPRSLALAEISWAAASGTRDMAEFEARLRTRLGDLERIGVNYRKLEGDCQAATPAIEGGRRVLLRSRPE